MDLDLAIIGGGPAGVATALFLVAAAPHLRDRIAILEKERYPREKICAGGIGARADRVLETIGVRVAVPSVPVHGMSVVAASGALRLRRSRPPGHDGEDPPIGRVVRRIEFDRAFADEARSRGVKILEGARVTSLDFEAGAVRIGSTLGDLRASAVVGADGVGSFVRRAIGLPRGDLIAQVAEVDTPAISGDPERDILHFDLTDTSFPGYAWDFPTLVGGQPLVCRGIYEIRAASPASEGHPEVGALLRARLERLGISPGGLRVKRFSERGIAPHEPHARPRALLVGEAAGIDPVLGEGIAQAILYGAAAGPYLARCLDRGDLSFGDYRRAIARSRIGFDLAIRRRFLRVTYGRSRPLVERLITRSEAFADMGMRYFAGEPVPRALLAKAAAAAGWMLATAAVRRGR